MTTDLIAVTARAAVFVVFLVACVSKIRSRAAFDEFRDAVHAMVLARLPMLPTTVIALEALVAVLVLMPATATEGLALAAALLAAFTAAGAFAQLRGRRAICRCFGAARPFEASHYVRNAVLAAVAVTAAFLAGGPPAELSALVPAATAGVALAVVLLVLDDLVPLPAQTPTEDHS